MFKKPTIVKGTRDYSALQLYRRSCIFNTIKEVYQQYGFEPLETPALEEMDTLTEKYGEEGEQLIFKILNSGDFLANITDNPLTTGHQKLLPQIVAKGLRYDLTVPLIRYVVTNQHLLAFPFRRYQIQPVWRADRPQKGRYREFYQCDADVIGTDSLLCEGEFLKMIHEVLTHLKIKNFTIKVNHRAILKSMVTSDGQIEKESSFCMTVDKLDKIGPQRVLELLVEQGFSQEATTKYQAIFALQGSNEEKLTALNNYLGDDKNGIKGISDLKQILNHATHLGLDTNAITITPTLARGLAYYTGMVIEVVVPDNPSIGGGGRYDSLTSVFGLDGVSGIGFSFGIDRLYDIMESQNLFDEVTQCTTKVMVTHLDPTDTVKGLKLLTQLRTATIKTEIYPAITKLKKQLTYANKKGIPFVIINDNQTENSEKYILKNMATGFQTIYGIEELITCLQ